MMQERDAQARFDLLFLRGERLRRSTYGCVVCATVLATMTKRHATREGGGARPSATDCNTPVNTNPHTTANPFAMDPTRFVISPTSTPPIAAHVTGTSVAGVHPANASLGKNVPRVAFSTSNTIGAPVIAISSVIFAGVVSPLCNSV